jgi:MFS family permease
VSAGNRLWYSELNRYQWFVLIVAALGWLFDCLDQQLFILARQPALHELLGESPLPTLVNEYSGYATSIFLIGWATGGLFFGVLGDRIGRAKTMMITILVYSAFTGLSAVSGSFTDFAFYRFLTGLGVGGEFAVGVALVAEVMPQRARPYALSMLQALSAVGNVSAALIAMAVGSLAQHGYFESTWRPLFVVGALPALLALVIRRRLKEPEQWQKAVAAVETQADLNLDAPRPHAIRREVGSYVALFGNPRWRKNALVGLGLAFAGVVGLWAVAFFTLDLVGNVLTKRFTDMGIAEKEIVGRVTFWKSITSLMINLGGFLGMSGFGFLTQRIGRKAAFAIGFVAALTSTAAVFAFLDQFWHIFVLTPIMGFCQLSLFAGYAIYFPELFPTHLRSTGISFCYNVGRFVAALGPWLLAKLTSKLFVATDEPLRYAGLTMCCIFVFGLLVLPFAPETKEHSLPD